VSLALTFQIAFASQPGDASYTWTTVPGSMDLSYKRGAPNEYGVMETGESNVEVGDAGSDLDPNNTGSAYYPNVRRGKPMRAFMTVDGTDYPLFQHFVERLPRSVSVGSVWTQRKLTGVDAFGAFALAGLKAVSYASELSGTRWGNVLDTIGWPAGRRNIDAGNSTLDAYTNDADSQDKALSHLLAVVDSENGFGFMDAAGDARFIQRHAFILDTSLAATFADGESIDTGDYPTAIPYTDLQPESTDIVNDYSGHRAAEGSTVLTASDATSIDDYGQRSTDVTSLVSTDNEVQDALNWKLSQTKDPYERVDAITVMPGNDSARWVTLLGLEVGDRVLVVEQPPGFAAPVETQFIVRHLEVNIPASLAASTFTFQLTPVAVDAWFVLDDTSAGRLDFNKLAY
jgi:hypothetical protein